MAKWEAMMNEPPPRPGAATTHNQPSEDTMTNTPPKTREAHDAYVRTERRPVA